MRIDKLYQNNTEATTDSNSSTTWQTYFLATLVTHWSYTSRTPVVNQSYITRILDDLESFEQSLQITLDSKN